MQLLIAGIELAGMIVPSVCAISVLARRRAIGDKRHAEEMTALRRRLVGSSFAPVAFACAPANERCGGVPDFDADLSATYTRRRPISRPMADVVADVLVGRCEAAGLAAPMTTPAQRDALAAYFDDVAGGALAYATELGLVASPAELPAAAPFALVGRALLYRPGEHETAWILCGVALRLLERAAIESGTSDVLHLVASLAGGRALLDARASVG